MGYYVYRLHLGVVDYAKSAGWELDGFMCQWGTFPNDMRCDGIISSHSHRPDIIEAIRQSGKPAVDFDYPFELGITWPSVQNDNFEIGRVAARHLLDRGFRHIGFVDFHSTIGERNRAKAMSQVAHEAGASFQQIDWGAFRDTLESLPKPFGLMIPDDTYAFTVMTTCLEAGLRIPEDIAIVGSGDDRLQCDLVPVPLSSVDERLEYRGWFAAELLDKMMKGESPEQLEYSIAPSHVVERKSTNVFAAKDDRVRKALAFMESEFRNPLTASQVARMTGVGRRRLDGLFREFLGRTVSEALTLLRLNESKRLLVETDLQVKEIAYMAGFSTPHHMIHCFKRSLGVTPQRYRKTMSGG
jgi:LacI family transcriptional regulator